MSFFSGCSFLERHRCLQWLSYWEFCLRVLGWRLKKTARNLRRWLKRTRGFLMKDKTSRWSHLKWATRKMDEAVGVESAASASTSTETLQKDAEAGELRAPITEFVTRVKEEETGREWSRLSHQEWETMAARMGQFLPKTDARQAAITPRGTTKGAEMSMGQPDETKPSGKGSRGPYKKQRRKGKMSKKGTVPKSYVQLNGKVSRQRLLALQNFCDATEMGISQALNAILDFAIQNQDKLMALHASPDRIDRKTAEYGIGPVLLDNLVAVGRVKEFMVGTQKLYDREAVKNVRAVLGVK